MAGTSWIAQYRSSPKARRERVTARTMGVGQPSSHTPHTGRYSERIGHRLSVPLSSTSEREAKC